MKWPTPPEWLAIYASSTAASSAAFAPLFGNNPAEMGTLGFTFGTIAGLAFCLAAMIRKRRP